MMSKEFKEIILLIFVLAISPYIFFLGNNFLLTEFFGVPYYLLSVLYSFFFIFLAICATFFGKKILTIILFFSYFSFLQFYFVNIQELLITYKDGPVGFYVLCFIIFVSFITTLSSKLSIVRNFIFIFLFLNILISLYNLIPSMKSSFQSFVKNTNTINDSVKNKNFTSVKYPNIFYIVPDGLASPKILKNYANIDFEDSIYKFEEKGFSVPMHNYSSYNTTYLSLAALFKMDYPATEKTPVYKNRHDFYPYIRDKSPGPKILQYLKKNNYQFVIVPPKWGGCPSSKHFICLTPASTLQDYFLYDYSISIFFKNSLLNKFFTNYFSFVSKKIDWNDTAKTALNKMKKNPWIWSDGGVFTMIHMMMPHSPYRERNCSITNLPEPSKEGYESSVHCSLSRLHELSNFIIKNYPNATIVVQSDHGIISEYIANKKFVEISNLFIDQRLGSFTAVKGCNSNQAARLNQVNIIRFIIECLVANKQTKQLKNKSYYGSYEESPDFGKVFRVYKK